MGSRAQKRHGERIRIYRKDLREHGVPEATIEILVERKRQRLASARRAGVTLPELDVIHDQTWAEHTPDDRGYQPTSIDPLQRGPARVNDNTAKAARRRLATTKFEYDRKDSR